MIRPRLWKLLQQRGRLRLPRMRQAPDAPHTLAWRDFTGLHGDSWVGPVYITDIEVVSGQTQLLLEGYIALKWEEVYAYEHTPHPIEYAMYYSC